MRVLQLIDSLRPGGAERMAVNLANGLSDKDMSSYLCATRQEGALKKGLKFEVAYLFLNKKYSLDLKALLKLRDFIKNEKITVVHAHGTSWFFAVLLKLVGVKIKLIWHDHYGKSLADRDIKLLRSLSRYFDGIISVNNDLKQWAKKELNCAKVIQLNNFITPKSIKEGTIKLKGSASDFKIICVANLRPQKDHFNLLEAFEISAQKNVNLTLHLVGEDPGTDYAKMFLQKIAKSPVAERIFYYGSQEKVSGMLIQADLGVLASSSEGLPLVLLEYGLAGLPVVCTDVGDCRKVIGDFGKLVPIKNPEAMAKAILFYLNNNDMMNSDAKNFQKKTIENYSEKTVLPKFLKFYKEILSECGN